MKFGVLVIGFFKPQMGLNLLFTMKYSSTPSELLHFSRNLPRISFGAIHVKALSGLILPFFCLFKDMGYAQL
jgi:hypothetical protein